MFPLRYVVTQLGLGMHKKASSFQLVLLDSALITIDTWVDGRERVRVRAGEFDCYRVRTRPDLDILFPGSPGFVKPVLSLVADAESMWVTVEEPQRFIKFDGELGPPGSLRGEVELVDMTDEHATAKEVSARLLGCPPLAFGRAAAEGAVGQVLGADRGRESEGAASGGKSAGRPSGG